jgi:MSHA biogenesis protein MshJ
VSEKWRQFAARFDALAQLERLLVTVGLLLAIAVLGYFFLLSPQMQRQASADRRAAEATAALTGIEAAMAQARAQPRDPYAGKRSSLRETRQSTAEIDAKLRDLSGKMLPPEKMPAFLESLLAGNPKLELMSLRTLPPSFLIERGDEQKGDKAGTATTEAPPNLYKHGIEIRIAGSYNDLLHYLEQLEAMPNRILWNKLVLVAEQYPRNVMTLTVFTLSGNRQWLIV